MNNCFDKYKPVFKYIGGKRWLKDELREKTEYILKQNKNINQYYEPFCGALGSFLSIYPILYKYNIKNIILNDINTNLIGFYNLVYKNPNYIIKKYSKIEKEYNKMIPKQLLNIEQNNSNEFKNLMKDAYEFFSNIRKIYNNPNTNKKEKAVYLLFLQKHSFNGIYRENLKGEYNSSFNYSNKFINLDNIIYNINCLHEILKQSNIKFLNKDFLKIKVEQEKTLIYADPPYVNINLINNIDDKNINNYSGSKFDIKKQIKLINLLKNSNCIYSNHKNNELISLFKKNNNNKVNIYEYNRKNIITPKKDTRSNEKIEILITNLLIKNS